MEFLTRSYSISGAVGDKTGKTSVLPGFSKIERGGGSVPQCYGGLTSPGGARHTNGAAGSEPILSYLEVYQSQQNLTITASVLRVVKQGGKANDIYWRTPPHEKYHMSM